MANSNTQAILLLVSGVCAGVTVAAVTSLLALAGVLYLLVRHRRAASEAEEGQLPTSTGGAPGTSDSNRRRRVSVKEVWPRESRPVM